MVGSVTMIDFIPLIRLDYMAKGKGFYTCNEGPRSFDFELFQREIIPDGPDLVR